MRRNRHQRRRRVRSKVCMRNLRLVEVDESVHIVIIEAFTNGLMLKAGGCTSSNLVGD